MSLQPLQTSRPIRPEPEPTHSGSADSPHRPSEQWRYNEILGWLHLWSTGKVIGGDLYLSKARRMSGRQKRMFRHLSQAFEIDLDSGSSNEQICSQLFGELQILADKPPIRDRFLDLTVLRNLAPFLNWRGLVRMQ
jgi:hypothetical protein